MDRNELNDRYFDWLCDIVVPFGCYRLLAYLHGIDFTYTIPMDGNRAEDGIEMRYRFASDEGYDYRIVANYIDDRPCSVLEMLVALAVRCEEHIMYDPDMGDRTCVWFWEMISSLGLDSMSDEYFDEGQVEDVIEHFLNRDYEPNGKGGLFTVTHASRDMRNIEIYYQMHAYLEDKNL